MEDNVMMIIINHEEESPALTLPAGLSLHKLPYRTRQSKVGPRGDERGELGRRPPGVTADQSRLSALLGGLFARASDVRFRREGMGRGWKWEEGEGRMD